MRSPSCLPRYVSCGIGLLIPMGLLVRYLLRLLHHLPPSEIIVGTFLPLGPCGQGSFALVNGDRVASVLFPALATAYPDSPAFHELGQIGEAM